MRSLDDDSSFFYTNFFCQLRLAQASIFHWIHNFLLNLSNNFLRLLPLLLCFQPIFLHRTNWENSPKPYPECDPALSEIHCFHGWQWRASEWRSRPPSTYLVFSPLFPSAVYQLCLSFSILRKYLHYQEVARV